MKNLLSVALVIMLLNAQQLYAQALRLPAPSPAQTIKQDFALSSVELNYSRPAMKDRKIFGDLVPYGKVWRTGANNATTLTFGDEVIIGDKKIPAGKYGLLTIPGESEWTVIISKQLDVTSPAAYKQDQDVVRVKAKAEQLPFPIESFMINFENIKPSSMDMVLLWDNVAELKGRGFDFSLNTAHTFRDFKIRNNLFFSQAINKVSNYEQTLTRAGQFTDQQVVTPRIGYPVYSLYAFPSAGLDPVTSRKLDELVLQVRDTFGTTIVIVSHELASIFGIADRVIMLERGAKGIIAEGPPRELALNSGDPRVSEFLRREDVVRK